MLRKTALVATLAFASLALAADWKEPEDKALHDREVKDYVVYLQALKKVGGKWHEQSRYVSTDVEKKALNEAAIERDEVVFAMTRVQVVARQLVIDAAPADTWEKAEKAASEKLSQAEKKLDEIMKNGPKELGELDKVNVELVRADRARAEIVVSMIVRMIKGGLLRKEESETKDAAKLHAIQNKLDDLKAEDMKGLDAQMDEDRKWDAAFRQKGELVQKLQKVGATDGLKQLELAEEARRDLEEVEAAKADKTAGKKLDAALDASVAPVKASLQEIEKAFAELGSPLFRAVAK